MRDLITGAVRTAVQVLVASLVTWLAARGITVDAVALEATLFAVTTGVITLVLNWASTKFPWLGKVLSLGLASGAPKYDYPV